MTGLVASDIPFTIAHSASHPVHQNVPSPGKNRRPVWLELAQRDSRNHTIRSQKSTDRFFFGIDYGGGLRLAECQQ